MGAAHRDLASGRWHTMTLVEQLANVGSEVNRAIEAQAGGRVRRRDQALKRALELFDLTGTDDRWRGHRRREVLRVREEFGQLFYVDDAPPGSAASLQRYFLQLGVLARRPPAA
jgi:hypothetical protein